MGGWVGGEMEIKANLSLRLVEVEAELGKKENTVSANLKVVHIGPKHVHIGHIVVQTTPKMG